MPIKYATPCRLCILTALALAQPILISALPQAKAETPAENARRSTVYIYFRVVNPDTGAAKEVFGSGFIVSPQGHVLTAAHLFKDWKLQTVASRTSNPIRASREDKPGYTDSAPLILQVINPGDAEYSDVALLKLPDPSTAYKPAPICFTQEAEMKIGDEVISYGFPLNKNYQPVKATLGTTTDGGRRAAASDFDEGMSGGPVYNQAGYVIGMVKGGIVGAPAVRWITPISFAYPVLIPPFKETCPLAASANSGSAAPMKICRLPAHGIEKYNNRRTVTLESGWRGGGYDQGRWCADALLQVQQQFPNGVFDVVGKSERSESKCPPFNCPQYNYSCVIDVQSDPVFKEMASPDCG